MKLGTVLNKVIRYCTYRDRSKYELEKFLDKFDLTPSEKLFILDYVIRENFVNEERYTLEYVNSKFKINKWGKNIIASNISRHNISEEVYKKAIEAIDRTEYIEVLEQLLSIKLSALSPELDTNAIKAKLFKYAFYKGFEPGLINQIIDKLLSTKIPAFPLK